MKTTLTCSLVLLASSLAFAKDALDIRPDAEANAALTGVEWENTNEVALAAATADDVLAAFVADEASAKALLAKIGGAYSTDSIAARQMAAVSQWVMGEEPCWLCFWAPSPAAGRRVWVDALLATAETASDAYVKMFCLDQLRWCGCDCPAVLWRIHVIGATGDAAVRDFSEMVIRELTGKSVGLPGAVACCAAKPACVCSECGCGGDFVPDVCTAKEKAEGFVPLFDGCSLAGWTLKGTEGCYRVGRCGELLFDHTVGSGTLWTDRDYADFTIRFEFRLSSDCNNGLGVRMPPDGRDAAFDGLEIQMLDDEGAMYTTTFPQLGLYQKACCLHGSVYGVIPSKHKPDGKSYLKPAGEWNEQEVTVVGSKIKVVLNGTVILDDDLSRYPTDGTTMDGQKHPGLRNKTGRLGWLSHGYPCRWRRIRIKEIK